MKKNSKLQLSGYLFKRFPSYRCLDVSLFVIRLKFPFPRFFCLIFIFFYLYLSYASNITDSNIVFKEGYYE